MVKIESLPLNVVLTLAKHELMSCFNTTNVRIKGVWFDLDWCDSDEEGDRSLMVTAEMQTKDNNNGTHPWVMVWNEYECDFHTVMRLDQNEKTNKED